MKKTAILIAAIAIMQLLIMSLFAADEIAAKPFIIRTKTASTMDIQFKVPDFEIEKEFESGKVWDKIRIEDSGYLIEKGLPELPTISTTIAIPNHGQVEIELINTRTKMINHIIPYPSQDGNIDNTPKGFSVNRSFYDGSDVYPQELIKYSDPQIIRDFRIITVQIQPFAWNSATQQLEVREQVDFRLRFNNNPGINELEGPQVISPSFTKIYESMILNFDDYRGTLIANTPPRYLMIYGAYTDATFLTKINDFAFWKRQKGADVRLVSTSVTGNTTTSIKAFIQNIYNDVNARPDFIVLIGDVSGSFPIPTYTESWSGLSGHGDYPYQHLAGSDVMGDVFLGRISAENTSQLDVILSKVYFYEKNINVNTAQWLNKMLLVGDTSPSGIGCQYVMKNIKEMGLVSNPDYTYTELYGSSPSADQMNQALNTGVGFYWYRGYIGMSNWSPGTSLINGVKLPHAIVVTCATNNFFSGESHMEKFIRSVGTAAVPAGAVTAIGMETSHTNPMCNNVLERGMATGIFVHGMRTMGETLLNGKLFLSSLYGLNHTYVANYSAHWCNLMGDPTMEVYITVPKTFSANTPAILPMGTSNLDLIILDNLSIPVKDACVTVSQNNLVIARGYTNVDGRVYLFFNTVLSAGTTTVTVSKHDFKPLQSIINVDGNGSLVSSLSMIDDDNIGSSVGNGNYSANSGETLEVLFSVRNSTTQMISNVTGYATSSSPYVTILNNALNFVSIDAGSSNYSLTPIVAQVASNCPHNTVIRFDMYLTDALDSTYVIPTYLTVTSAYMTYISYQIIDQNNQALDPGESVELNLTVKNNGTVPITDLYGQLVTLNDLVLIQDNIGYFGNIMAGTQISSVADAFQLYGRTNILRGTIIPMKLKLYNAAGFLQWLDFSFTVGVVTSTDPLGPDAYGYVIYDVTDVSYADCPTYQWIGIAPAEGGQGTIIQLTDSTVDVDGDAESAVSTASVSLPFSFIFYGIPYSQITVCSNGFIAMGSTGNGNWANCQVPGNGAPSPLIAPFWDDLIMGSGGVYKWYDSINHRFIVEWYNLKNGHDQSSVETFQVILYDPVYYPTSLGDGPIKIQYLTFNNIDDEWEPTDISSSGVSGSGNYATIGIQNLDQTMGLQYSFNNTYPTAAASLSNQKALYITTAPIYYYTPHLVYDSAYVLDNNNNVIETNETVDLYVNLMNIGEQTAENVTTTIASTSPYVTIINNASAYAPIPGSDNTGVNSTPFRFTVSADCPDKQILPFVININNDPNYWQRTFNLTVEKPSLTYFSYMVSDTTGNNNGVADPGENIILTLNIKNGSQVDAHNLTSVLSTTNTDITISNPNVVKPVVSSGETMQISYLVSLGATITPGMSLPFNITVSSTDAPPINQNIAIPSGTSGMVMDFESTNGYFESVSGWSFGTPVQTTPHSGNKLWCTGLDGQYANNAMFILKTPTITLGTDATLSFWHMMSCQNYYDGGNVSISTNGGSTWILLNPVNGYNTSLNVYSLGEVGYTNIVSWSQVTFNLSLYAGSDVILRWRFGSNPSVQGLGWFIDDVMISGYFITPGIVSGNVTLSSEVDPALTKVVTSNNIVTNPDAAGDYVLYLPQGNYTVQAQYDYHTTQISPEFVLNNQQLSYTYNFTLDYLSNPTDLIYSLTTVDSIVYLAWTAPAQVTYPVLRYHIYRRLGDHPYQLLTQTTATSYADRPADVGIYSYFVKAEYDEGLGAPSNIIEVNYPPVANEDEPLPVFVNLLNANYPNPFNPTTTISFSLAKAGQVSLKIYNTKGQLVKTLLNNQKDSGLHKIVWDGINNAGKPVSSGLYFYRLDAPGYSKTRKMMMLK